MALAAALSALGKGLDRKVIGPTGCSTVLYTLLVADTGAGKQHGIDCIRMLLRAIGDADKIAAGNIASVQAVEEIVVQMSSAFVVIDEFGSFLARIGSGQGGNVSEIPGILQSLWGWKMSLEWIGTKKKGEVAPTVHGVALSMFGASTERALFTALKKKELSSGFVNRMLLINIGAGWQGERLTPKYDILQCPTWLAKALKKAAETGDGTYPNGFPLDSPVRLLGNNGRVLRDFRRIGWGPGAEQKWKDVDKEVRTMPSADDKEIWARAPEIAIRIATIVAVYRGSTVVELEDFEWAWAVASHSARELQRCARAHMLEDMVRAELTDLLRREWRAQPTKMFSVDGKQVAARVLTEGQIRKLCEKNAADSFQKIDQVIDHLLKTGEIEEVTWTGAGRPTKRWRWIGD
jgi:hypothetical protein